MPSLIAFGAGKDKRSNLPLLRKPKSQNKGCKSQTTKRKASDEPSPVSKNFAGAKKTNYSHSYANTLMAVTSLCNLKDLDSKKAPISLMKGQQYRQHVISFIKDKDKQGSRKHTESQWMYKQHSSSSRENWIEFTPEASKYIEQVWDCFMRNKEPWKRVVENGNHKFEVNVKNMTYENQNTREKNDVKRKVYLRAPMLCR